MSIINKVQCPPNIHFTNVIRWTKLCYTCIIWASHRSNSWCQH